MTTAAIPLSKGYVATIDADLLYETLSCQLANGEVFTGAIGDMSWHVQNKRDSKYAHSTCTFGRKVYLHRLVMQAARGVQVDHIDGDGLNNRRSNLRICTNGLNQRNQRKSAGKTSQYKGVSRHKASGKWQAFIQHEGKSKWLGNFENEVAAAIAYDFAAERLFGEFAHVNFPFADQAEANGLPNPFASK
jgi:hypothetical protein